MKTRSYGGHPHVSVYVRQNICNFRLCWLQKIIFQFHVRPFRVFSKTFSQSFVQSVSWMDAVWPDLVTNWDIFGHIFKGFWNVFGKVVSPLWDNLYAFGQIFIVVNGQILKNQFGHLGTLVGWLVGFVLNGRFFCWNLSQQGTRKEGWEGICFSWRRCTNIILMITILFKNNATWEEIFGISQN